MVRVGPNAISYTKSAAWKDIYGRGYLPRDPIFYGSRIKGIPDNLVFADGEDHKRLRRAFAPAFSERALSAQQDVILTYAKFMITQLKKEEGAVDFVKYLNLVTMDIMSELVFGEPMGLLKGLQYTPYVTSHFEMLKGAGQKRAGAYFPLGASILERAVIPKHLLMRLMYSIGEVRKQIDAKIERVKQQGDQNDSGDLWGSVLNADKKGVSRAFRCWLADTVEY